LLVTELLIRRSGYALRLQNEEYFDDIIVGIAEGNIELDELDQWFKDRLIRV